MSGKPTGVIIIALLQLISSLVAIGLGVLVLAFTLLLPLLFMILALIPLIIGFIGLILFWGLWTLKGWAWFWTLFFNFVAVLLGLLSFDLANLTGTLSWVLNIIIVIYLLLPATKAAFR
jgi:uncharacterized membrane protein (DUF2068 family)